MSWERGAKRYCPACVMETACDRSKDAKTVSKAHCPFRQTAPLSAEKWRQCHSLPQHQAPIHHRRARWKNRPPNVEVNFLFDQHDVDGHKPTTMLMTVARHATKLPQPSNWKRGILRNIVVPITQKLVEQITELPAEKRVAGKEESACDIPEGVGTLFSMGAQMQM